MNIRGSKGHEKTTSGQDDLYLNNLTVYDSTILEGPVSLKRQNTLQNSLLNQVNLLIPNYEFVSYNFEFPASAGTAGQVFVSGGGSSPNYWVTPGSSGVGTVTSVGINTPSLFTVTGSPITTSGTITLTYSGTPLPILYGGTGLTAVGTSGQVLQSNGSTLIYTTPGSGGIGTVTSVSVTVPSFMNVTPSTITTSGTFAITASSTGTGDVVLNSNPNILNLSTEGATAYAGDDGSAAITSAGGVHIDGNMYMTNDNRTVDTGIIATYAANTVILGGTISASAPVSYPGIYGVLIQGEPEAGENVTIVDVPHLSLGSFALGVDGGALIDDVVLSGDMKIFGLSSFLGDITIGVTYIGATPVKSTAVQFLDAEITYDGTSFTYYYGSATNSLLAITSVDLNADTRLYLPKISWSNYTGVYPDIVYTDLMSLTVAETDAGQVASFTMGNYDTQFLQTLCYPFFAPPFWGTIYGTGETYITPDNNLMNIGVSSEGTVFTAEIVWNSSITGGYENMAIGSETGVGPFITMYSALDVELFSVVPDYFYFNALDFYVGYNTDNPADVLVEKVYIYSTLSCDIKTFTGTLSLTTTTGSLALTTGAGAMSFTTGGGTMDLATGAGAMTVNTGGGDLSFDLGAGTTNFNTGGGDMSFDMGAGSINFNMGAGIMAFDIGAGGWTVNAAAGEVLFDLGAGGFNTNIVNGEYKLIIDTFTGAGDAITLSSLDYTGGGDAIHLEVGTYQGAGDAIALVVTDCNVAGNGIKLETTGFLGAGDSIFISADSYAGIGDAIGIVSSAYAGTGKAVNIESTISGDVNVQAGLGNVTISSNSGAVKIDAPSGGLVIGTAGYNHGVGNMTVYAGNGAFSTETGNISFTTIGYATYTGPGNFTIDTTLAYVGNIYMLAKGGISMKSYGGTYTLSLDTHYMTSSYSWNYPATAGTAGYVLLSGGGVAANYWSSALTLDSVALRSSSGAYTITLSGYDATASYTFYFPPTKGTANQLLTTDGSGNSSFTSDIIVNSVTTPTITYAAADMKISSAFNVDLDSSGTGGYGVIVGYNTSKISGLGYPFTIYNNATDRTIMMQAVSRGTGIGNQYIAINTPVELGASTGSAGQVFTSQGTTSAPIWTNASAGTVTSIGMTVPSFMSVTPSTITTSGTFAITASSTGTGNVVLSNSPTLVSPTLGNAYASTLLLGTPLAVTNGGTGVITSTGTGSVVLNTSPSLQTLTNKGTLTLSQLVGSSTISIACPSSGVTSYNITLPTTSGTLNYPLVTDGTGTTSWAPITGTGMYVY